MSENELIPEGGIEWEREVRGYNRQQVDNYVAWRAGQVRDLESRLSQSLAEIEHLRREAAEARASARRPPHEEISERVGQILKLAADEAKADRERGSADANELRDAARAETDKLRADVKQEVDRFKAEAQERAERMLTAAQEQADRAVATARTEAEELVSTARASADKTVSEANQHAESTVSTALAQAKQQLDDATARATAIHDGAERRLNLLISRHTETVRRLTEIRDVVTGLVSGEASRGSLEDEVNRALSVQQAANGTTGSDGRQPATAAAPAAAAQTAAHNQPVAHSQPMAHSQPVSHSQPHPAPAPRAPRQAGPADGRRAAEPASRDSQSEPVPTPKHATDAAMRAAEEIRQARTPDRVLGETTAGSSGRSIE